MQTENNYQAEGVPYGRVSDTKQIDGESLTAQPDSIKRWAKFHNVYLHPYFSDGGVSGGTFNRPEWKALEAYVKKHKRIKYILVSKYDRFIRNVLEGLKKLEKYEQKLGIRIVAVDEPITAHPDSPAFFKQRTELLLDAEVERRKGKDRVMRCNRTAWIKGKRAWNRGWVWENYENEEGKATIRPKPGRDKVVLRMFEMARAGNSHKSIREYANSEGWPMKGNSAVRNALTNETFAARKTVPPYLHEPQVIVKLDIPQIVPTWLFNEVQDMLEVGVKKKVYRPEIPLRPWLLCGHQVKGESCSKPIGGGPSKAPNGSTHWYYNCNHHGGNNNRAERVDGWILDVFDTMSYTEAQLKKIEKETKRQLSLAVGNEKASKNALGLELEEVRTKLDTMEERYALGLTKESIYEKFASKYENEIQEIEQKIAGMGTSQKYWASFKEMWPQLSNLTNTYSSLRVPEKHRFLGLIFPEGVYLTKKGFRTTKINSIFNPNLKRLRQLRFFEYHKKSGSFGKLPLGAPQRNETEQLFKFLREVA